MAATKMTRKGQVTIPVEIREQLGLHEGDHFIVHAVDGKVVFESQRDIARRTAGALAEYGKKMPPLAPHQIRALAAHYIAEEVMQSMLDESNQLDDEVE